MTNFPRCTEHVKTLQNFLMFLVLVFSVKYLNFIKKKEKKKDVARIVHTFMICSHCNLFPLSRFS